MRVSSRRMPKAIERKAGPFRWLFICVIAGALLYLALSYRSITAMLFGITAISAIVGRSRIRQMRGLAATRAGEGICEFARAFNTRVTDPWVIRAVYEEVQACLSSELPLRASDRLEKDLHIDPDDLDMDIAVRVAERTGRSLSRPEGNPYYGRVNTVQDLVNYFNSQPHSVGTPPAV